MILHVHLLGKPLPDTRVGGRGPGRPIHSESSANATVSQAVLC
jgi:hypothetical protein